MKKLLFIITLLVTINAYSQDKVDSYYYDGTLVQYYNAKHYFISMCLEQCPTGRPYQFEYCVHISILNKDVPRFDFIPEEIKAYYTSSKGKTEEEPIIPYEKYRKKLETKRNIAEALNGLAICFQTFSDCYYGTSTTTVKQEGGTIVAKTYDRSGINGALIQNESNIQNKYNGQIQTLKQGYLKRNTLFSNREVAGYIFISGDKKDLKIVLPINGENFEFNWKVPNTKKEKYKEVYNQ
jgi:hypothetical protein